MSDAPNNSNEIAKLLTPEQEAAARTRASEQQQLARRMNYSGHGGIAVNNYEELVKLADTLARSGYFKDVRDAAQAVVKIQFGAELGIPPMAAMQNLYIVEGRVSMSAAMIAARINKSPDVRTTIRKRTDGKGLEWDADHCIIDWRRLIDGEWIDVGESSFTIQEARMAGLVKDKSNWEKYPKAMNYNRAITQGARAFCPDLFFGAVYDSDSSEIEAQPERVVVEKPAPQSSADKLTAHVEKAQAQATALPEVTEQQKKPRKQKEKENVVDAEVTTPGEGSASASSDQSTATTPTAPAVPPPAVQPSQPTDSVAASTNSTPTASPSVSMPAASAPSTPPSQSVTAAVVPDSSITITAQTDVVAVESALVPPTASTSGPTSATPAPTSTESSTANSAVDPVHQSQPTTSSAPASSPPASPTSTPTATGEQSAAGSSTTNDDVQLIAMLKRIPRHNFGLMTEHLSSARSQLSPRGIELVRLLSKAEFQGQSRGDDQRFAGLSDEEANLAKEAAFMVEVNGGFTNPTKKDFDAMTPEQKAELASKNR